MERTNNIITFFFPRFDLSLSGKKCCISPIHTNILSSGPALMAVLFLKAVFSKNDRLSHLTAGGWGKNFTSNKTGNSISAVLTGRLKFPAGLPGSENVSSDGLCRQLILSSGTKRGLSDFWRKQLSVRQFISDRAKLHIQKATAVIAIYKIFNPHLILNKIPCPQEHFKKNHKILPEKLPYCPRQTSKMRKKRAGQDLPPPSPGRRWDPAAKAGGR